MYEHVEQWHLTGASWRTGCLRMQTKKMQPELQTLNIQTLYPPPNVPANQICSHHTDISIKRAVSCSRYMFMTWFLHRGTEVTVLPSQRAQFEFQHLYVRHCWIFLRRPQHNFQLCWKHWCFWRAVGTSLTFLGYRPKLGRRYSFSFGKHGSTFLTFCRQQQQQWQINLQ